MNVSYAIALIISAAISAVIAVIAWKRRAAPGASGLMFFNVADVVWAGTYAVRWMVVDPSAQFFWLDVTYFGAATHTTLAIIFTLQFTNRSHLLTRRNLSLLAIVPIITLVLLWTDKWHGLFFGGHRSSGAILDGGPWFWFFILYTFAQIIIIIALLVHAYLRASRLYRRQAGTVLLASVFPVAGIFIGLAGLSPFTNLDLTPFTYSISGLIYAYGLFGFRMFDVMPVARNKLVDEMTDGVIVLDANKRIVDINPAAERLIGISAKVVGQSANDVLSPRLHLDQGVIPIEASLMDLRISENPQRDIEFQVLPLLDHGQNINGQLIILHDITERKIMENTRQAEKEALAKLLSVSEEFLANSGTEVDFQKITDDLLWISGGKYAVFNLYDEDGRDFQSIAISGKKQNILKARALLGFDLKGKKWPQDEVKAVKIRDHIITRFASLFELTENVLAKAILELVIRIFDLGEVVIAKISTNEKVIGDFTIIMSGGERFSADNLVSIYIRQVGLFLQRTRAEAGLRQAQDELECAHRELKESFVRQQQLAQIDDLTNINNHRSLMQLAERELNFALRHQIPLSIMFFDIDNFKQVNDTFGHAMGDQALKLTIQTVFARLRSSDLIGRYGGDEFVILLPHTSADEALALAERIHASIAVMSLDTGKGPLTLTISSGIAQSIHNGSQMDTVENLLHRADLALYAAKQSGKNCTVIFDSI